MTHVLSRLLSRASCHRNLSVQKREARDNEECADVLIEFGVAVLTSDVTIQKDKKDHRRHIISVLIIQLVRKGGTSLQFPVPTRGS